MEFTPQQRLAMYESAYKHIANKNYKVKHESYYLCYNIALAAVKLGYVNEEDDDLILCLPEIMAERPKEHSFSWWNSNEKPRLKALLNAIENVKKVIEQQTNP